MWITYPADHEIWLGNIFNNRRTERGAMFPPFWKQDSHYVTVEFSTIVRLEQSEEVEIHSEGKFNLMLDGKLQYGQPTHFTVPAGEHRLNFKVWNQATPPALFVKGKTIETDSSWLATYEDKIWIDENGVAHGSGIYKPAATSPYFLEAEQPPSGFKLDTRPMTPVNFENIQGGRLYDFGKEMMGLLRIDNIKFTGSIEIYYGESREEALDHEHCETLDKIDVLPGMSRTLESKAFRFVHVLFTSTHGNTHGTQVWAHYEYLYHDLSQSGTFRCNDDLLNNIWDVSAYTMDLTTREFFIDGIKRDRWTWSGDAIQSYLMNYYLRFDSECVKRTIRQLRGKDPVTAHVNTIMDYTFYWFKSVLDYYEYTADIPFLREMYPRMTTLMRYVLSRLNEQGLAEGMPDDWIFVDWVDFPMHKRGTLAFEQILFAKALETMALSAQILRDHPQQNPPQGSITTAQYEADAQRYMSLFKKVRETTDHLFWDDNSKAYLHSLEDGQLNTMVTKFPNMFAILFGYADKDRQADIMRRVMNNPAIEAITTPYMRFYELETLLLDGQYTHVLSEIRDYWGGMLREGATSFWEKYVPSETGIQHLQMYGRPYGKSLCHAWGASPVYLLGKYYLGIRPTSPGYAQWECRPNLGDLTWMEGSVPTPHGPIHLSMTTDTITITTPIPGGTLRLSDRTISLPTGETTVRL